ncbi:hypothetical protein HDU97_008991, partial [Phlyctochytrium planicorne]
MATAKSWPSKKIPGDADPKAEDIDNLKSSVRNYQYSLDKEFELGIVTLETFAKVFEDVDAAVKWGSLKGMPSVDL